MKWPAGGCGDPGQDHLELAAFARAAKNGRFDDLFTSWPSSAPP
ncbi:MAG: hypothetical protein ABIS86_16895 [Streptosporangiaceae bacterium]